MNDEIVSIVQENPQSSILIKHGQEDDWIRIDVREDLAFSVKTGSTLSDVDIDTEESTRKKSREDLNLRLSSAGMKGIRKVYAISRVGEDEE